MTDELRAAIIDLVQTTRAAADAIVKELGLTAGDADTLFHVAERVEELLEQDASCSK